MIGLPLQTNSQESELRDAAEKADAIAVGPGLGQSTDARRRLELLMGLDRAMVVDADALNMLAQLERWPEGFKAKAVLTPHPGEMARLGKLIGRDRVPSNDAGRIDMALSAARAFGQVLVLKGARTVVTDGSRVYINQSGDSTLSKAGTGDILSGMLGCLLAQRLDRFDAAVLAVHLHGLAGQWAGQRHTRRGATAQQIIDAIPRVS
jgi:NAD(P)H-hydrate epimerase